MSWRRTFGVLAVLLVVGTVLGTIATFLTANDLLRAGPERTPALLSLVLLVVAFGLTILAASPSRDWIGNPYW